ncbi:flagellar protein FliT [Bacillus sp. 03113]|uniref:flagellar protein FliT n=1 Tax=Bacillus sp. 03113 TaxID=2578211 RepID=UPI0011430AED|nr:flagellar protein FliT [Bacillus sp. 03113]
MNALRQYYAVTVELLDLFKNSTMERDEKILAIEQLLEKRETWMQQIKPPYSEEDRKLGSTLIELERSVASFLQKEKLHIQKDLNELNVKKNSTNKYINPYQSLSSDGVFYDKRN